MNIPKVIDTVVRSDLCIGCGLCIYSCPTNALEMQWNEHGFLIPNLSGSCNLNGDCLKVCPFNPFPEKEVRTENEIAELFLPNAENYHLEVVKYNGIYAGYANEFRLISSSGGMATYIFTELLERGVVDQIFSVKESETPGVHYEYAISNNKKELLAASKTRYFPVTMATVFAKINKLEGKVAIVGVACFIKAIRLAQHTDPILKDKIPFLVGIICGGVKSRFFTEYLADKAGVLKDFCYKPEFRIKDINSTASDYSFGCFDKKDNKEKAIKLRTVGDMWGTGLFKANACDFCDDVTTELADISLGDAWMEPYIKDGKGTNVVVTRSILAKKIITDGIASKKLNFEKLSLNRFLSSQQGSFNHRRKGLPFRIKLATNRGKVIPPKRFDEGSSISIDFKLVQFCRMKTRLKSLEVWQTHENAELFDKKMKKNLYILGKATLFYHIIRRIFYKLKSARN